MGVKGNKSRTGMTNSPEMRKHISEALQGYKCGLGNKSRTGQKRSPEEIAKQIATREATGVNFHTEATKKKLSEQRIGKPHPARDKVIENNKARTGWKHTDESKQKMSDARKGKPVSPQCLEKALLARGKFTKPNKLEKGVMTILNKYFPDEWKFVGDGGLLIGTKNPDFVRNHGHNQVIEIYGDYWHQGENPQDRIDIFDKSGYQTLVMWESEFENMDEQEFTQIVLKFMQKANLFYYNPTQKTINNPKDSLLCS